ncbi:hypothetical protein F2Q68_00023290 [Brassica cretica]|uniref:Uncharacterized protein n=1 Tax=Brassica cretica TaxID=69181 RepID=A0A8S9FQD8_BRACR|nr:hypothetical protein F2Q68_00023290 [Brassica cretica]
MRNRLVGNTIPAPTELLNVSMNLGAVKLRYLFPDNSAIFPAHANTCPWIPLSLNHLNGKSKERSANAVTATSPPTKSRSYASPQKLTEISPGKANERDLFEPTVCTKVALDEINKLFAMPMDF